MALSEKQLFNARKRVAKTLDGEVLDCRLIGHQWQRVLDDPDADAPLFGIRICYECQRCLSGRCDIVQRSNGDLLARHYQYVDHYHLDAIDGERPTQAAVLRYETIRRIDQTATPPGVPPVGQ